MSRQHQQQRSAHDGKRSCPSLLQTLGPNRRHPLDVCGIQRCAAAGPDDRRRCHGVDLGTNSIAFATVTASVFTGGVATPCERANPWFFISYGTFGVEQIGLEHKEILPKIIRGGIGIHIQRTRSIYWSAARCSWLSSLNIFYLGIYVIIKQSEARCSMVSSVFISSKRLLKQKLPTSPKRTKNGMQPFHNE